MIEDFLTSWELFGNAWTTGWLVGVLLALVGVVVVARDQVFLGAAVSQASTLGIAVALALGAWLGEEAHLAHLGWLPAAMAVLFSVLAALVTSIGGREGRESREAITGWVFLISSSFSILVVSFSPHGLEEVHKLLFSNVISATAADVALFAALLAVTAGLVLPLHRRLLLLTMDPPMAAAVGMRVRRWNAGVAVWLGLVAGLALEASGFLFTFGCLVLPALAAKGLVREVRSMFVVAPAIAAVVVAGGFVAAHASDRPHAQVGVALLGLVVLASWAVRRRR